MAKSEFLGGLGINQSSGSDFTLLTSHQMLCILSAPGSGLESRPFLSRKATKRANLGNLGCPFTCQDTILGTLLRGRWCRELLLFKPLPGWPAPKRILLKTHLKPAFVLASVWQKEKLVGEKTSKRMKHFFLKSEFSYGQNLNILRNEVNSGAMPLETKQVTNTTQPAWCLDSSSTQVLKAHQVAHGRTKTWKPKKPRFPDFYLS